MAITYAPKLTSRVVAVRLKKDLLVEEGTWIAIDLDSETVTPFTHEQFQLLYGAERANKDVPSTVRKKGPNVVKKSFTVAPTVSRNGSTAISVMTHQPGRFWYMLRTLNRPATSREVHSLVANPLDDNPQSVTPALCSLREFGLVESKQVPNDKSLLWTVTKKGCELFEKLGPVCFTDFGLQVPPDQESPARKLAEAWKDRHST